MRVRGWQQIAIAVLVVTSTFVLSACNVGLGAGLGGGLVTLVLVLLLAGGSSATQTGCDTETVEACLTTLPPDGGWTPPDASDAGDAGTPDAGPDTTPSEDVIRPCLSPPPRDSWDPGDQPDAVDDGGAPPPDSSSDTDSDAANFDGDASEAIGRRSPDRQEILERLGDRLPDDVVDRLSDEDEPA